MLAMFSPPPCVVVPPYNQEGLFPGCLVQTDPLKGAPQGAKPGPGKHINALTHGEHFCKWDREKNRITRIRHRDTNFSCKVSFSSLGISCRKNLTWKFLQKNIGARNEIVFNFGGFRRNMFFFCKNFIFSKKISVVRTNLCHANFRLSLY